MLIIVIHNYQISNYKHHNKYLFQSHHHKNKMINKNQLFHKITIIVIHNLIQLVIII
jgi:hypothetical protein